MIIVSYVRTGLKMNSWTLKTLNREGHVIDSQPMSSKPHCREATKIEWRNYDVRTRKSNSLRVPSRFSYGVYNGVFQFMSKIKPVVNTT